MDSQVIAAVLLGLALAASTGLNTFLPLWMLAGSAHFGWFNAQHMLNGHFAWVSSDGALLALTLATVVEVVGDKIPVVDHLLDVFGTVARPAVGTFAAASVLHGSDPAMEALAGLVVGAPIALGVHGAKAATRATSSATTLGMGNPVLSTIEDIAAAALVIIGLVAPWLVPVVLVVLFWMMWRLFKKVRGQWPFKRAVTV